MLLIAYGILGALFAGWLYEKEPAWWQATSVEVHMIAAVFWPVVATAELGLSIFGTCMSDFVPDRRLS